MVRADPALKTDSTGTAYFRPRARSQLPGAAPEEYDAMDVFSTLGGRGLVGEETNDSIALRDHSCKSAYFAEVPGKVRDSVNN